ncbi:MAG: hypothetical protein H6779_02240 [Candidatus Nomurabacteria bacterium]|nr:hypothetical protein [Candidatus Nomurabacteria bacterium]USN88244.1 MAG: hypothetical protein H6779_02240 [Candidatus Nomurabacteria bacterium]
MSNDTKTIERLFKLQTKINMMVVDGVRDAESVADVLQQILEEKREYLRRLKTVTLAPTQGSVTLAEAEDVFTGYLDSDFKNWSTDVSGEDTNEVTVDVHEMTRNGTYETLFESLGDPRQLALSQGQIVEFCRNHRDSLRQGGYGTFFLFEVNGVLFVARVLVDVGLLKARVFRFDDGNVWNADDRRRLVVQQQTV